MSKGFANAVGGQAIRLGITGMLSLTIVAAALMAWKQEGSAAPASDILSETLLVEAVQIDNFLGVASGRARQCGGGHECDSPQELVEQLRAARARCDKLPASGIVAAELRGLQAALVRTCGQLRGISESKSPPSTTKGELPVQVPRRPDIELKRLAGAALGDLPQQLATALASHKGAP